ncbi:hypothetical protein [Lysobacter gummosus]|uniref:hypothetical protein n=1 Tax=Lysobacter gummosus TaxID=262324 RepID=UPI003624D2E9
MSLFPTLCGHAIDTRDQRRKNNAPSEAQSHSSHFSLSASVTTISISTRREMPRSPSV